MTSNPAGRRVPNYQVAGTVADSETEGKLMLFLTVHVHDMIWLKYDHSLA
jgi:hypothetical protein